MDDVIDTEDHIGMEIMNSNALSQKLQEENGTSTKSQANKKVTQDQQKGEIYTNETELQLSPKNKKSHRTPRK